MADFKLYYPKLKKYEGGYASEAYAKKMGDSGGETYKGIARNYNKDWAGWKIIDAYKAKNGEPKWNTFIKDPELDRLAEAQSKRMYWDAMRLDEVQNQSLAELIADYGFNTGVGSVSRYVQRFAGVKEDGKIGTDTIKAVNTVDQEKLFNDLKNHRIRLITESSKISDKNKPGLLTRAKSFAFDNKKVIVAAAGVGFFFWVLAGLVVIVIVYRQNKK